MPYFKGDFSVFSKSSGLLDFSSGELEKIKDIEVQSNFRENSLEMSLGIKGIGDSGAIKYGLPDASMEGSLLKAIVSSLIYNEAQLFSNLLSLDLSSEIDQTVVEFFENYILEVEKKKMEEEQQDSKSKLGKVTPEVELTDISSASEEEEVLTIEEVLKKPFYLSLSNLFLEMCDFGPCLNYNSDRFSLVFSRELLNLRKIKFKHLLESGEEVGITINFDNYQKIGGRYNFPKNIITLIGDKKYLIKLNSFYLSKRVPISSR